MKLWACLVGFWMSKKVLSPQLCSMSNSFHDSTLFETSEVMLREKLVWAQLLMKLLLKSTQIAHQVTKIQVDQAWLPQLPWLSPSSLLVRSRDGIPLHKFCEVTNAKKHVDVFLPIWHNNHLANTSICFSFDGPMLHLPPHPYTWQTIMHQAKANPHYIMWPIHVVFIHIPSLYIETTSCYSMIPQNTPHKLLMEAYTSLRLPNYQVVPILLAL